MKPKISIITPSLNSRRYIRDAIQSVLQQDYENVEHIVVDGGSTDGTIEILKQYPHLKWISEPDTGQSNAMNKGFRLASGEIIGYLNVDDYYLPGAFTAVIPWFARGAKFVVGKIKVVMDDGSYWINDARVGHLDMLKHWESEAYCVNSTGYFYRREVQDKVGKFNENNRLTMDLEFLLDASKYFEFTKIDSMLGVFRYRAGTATFNSQRSKDMWTIKTFDFIDRFLEGMPEEFVQEFERDRARGYETRIRWQHEERLKELGKKRQAQAAGNWLSRAASRINTVQVMQRIKSITKGFEGK